MSRYAITIKGHIEFLYDLTKDGYVGSMSSFESATLRKVCSELVRRGVISMSTISKNKRRYLWVATMAPTSNLCLDVAKTISSRQREIDKARRCKNKEVNPIQVEVAVPAQKSLSEYSIQELWDEIKSRGVVIEDNKLVMIQKTYFN